MPRNATTSPSAPRRSPAQWTSHLRQISKTSFDRTPLDPPHSPDTASSVSTVREAHPPKRVLERTCTVSINESIIGAEVLLNLELLGGGIRPGSLMSITPLRSDQDRSSSVNYGSLRPANIHRALSSYDDPSKQDSEARRKPYIFIVKDVSKELKARQPHVEVYVAKHIGDAFGMKKGTQVVLAPVDDLAPAVEASHVELSFRDMYLSRADMWRLAVAELTDKTVYKGQVLYFLGTVKATVTTVFVDGRKVHSAFFCHNTRPIFRSESARYVLFIQMAREMWDFDPDDSGEIMFHKVVNGFLPALFKKWAMLQVKHLVSIVLFARVEYDTGLTSDLASNEIMNDYYTGYQTSGDKRPYKDFYRVVVSEMSSGEWTTILHQLKREFNSFRKDISLHHQDAMSAAMNLPDDATDKANEATGIKAESSSAMYGNFLEAINLASSQYAHDYIDRDLLRTGISIVVISPGSGVFEVEYENLRRSTEALVGNGIGIDLICIPKIPLHSVPLFRYRNPLFLDENQRSQSRSVRSRDSTPKVPTPLVGSYTTLTDSLSPTKASDGTIRLEPLARLYTDEWAFALPQWLHVSYWTGKSEEALSYHGISLSALERTDQESQEDFTIRCRLYDLQMRSVLETNEIETTPLYADPKFPQKTLVMDSAKKTRDTGVKTSSSALKLRGADGLFEPVYGFHKFNVERLSKPGETSLWKQLQAFDDNRSRLPKSRIVLSASKLTRDLEEVTRKQLVEDTGLFGSSVGDKKGGPSTAFSSSLASVSQTDTPPSDTTPSTRRDSIASTLQPRRAPSIAPSIKMPRLMRQISLGQKGFGIAAPKAATAEIRAENVNALHAGQQAAAASKISQQTPKKPNLEPSSPKIIASGRPFRSLDQAKSNLSDQLQDLVNTPSRPIIIKSASSHMDSLSHLKSGSMLPNDSVLDTPTPKAVRREDQDQKFSNMLRAEDIQKMYTSKLLGGAIPELPSTLSPSTAMAPWLVVLNPSNPNVSKVDDAILYSRWQHVFPRPSDMKLMKWKSLSSPAAVPLTTEHFPTKAQFDTEYQRQPYNIAQETDDDLAEEPKSREYFLRELISARFAHGFQVVIGPSVARAFGQKLMKIADVFSRDRIVEDGTSLFMSIGNTIHQLSCVNGTEVEVNIFVRKPTESFLPANQPLPIYKPAIRTTLDPAYEQRQIDIVTPKPEKNWNYIDSYLAGHFEEMTENLRFWRTRFVLIPMTSRASMSKSHIGADNDEEVRLEGIKRLAQAWQRYRYLPPSERHFQSAGRKSKDPNPLDIVYKTEDPSVVIAAEMETLPLFESLDPSSRKGLVSDKERFSKSNFNISALAEAIQQPAENGGIRMQNRRWHLRLHYNCFIGSDMTTWLLDNFEDLESREEAVELGESLMIYDDDRMRDRDVPRDTKKDRERGIFVHVERRHKFRDGQYFYQVASEYAKPQPHGWLNMRRRDYSVPSTPLVEQGAKESPRSSLNPVSRPTSIHEEASPVSGATTPTVPLIAGKKPKVFLSKVMKYDVDHRKKSYRPERINLHYDRLHNPDNCYHIRIDWMSVTGKLIEDAVKGWAAIAASHGLRLVEVPIAEACSITEQSPFRRPYHIKIALPPPSQRPATYYDPNSFNAQSQPGKHYYQKALLRKFDFVLDVEAASNFPANVDVSYSWGKPEFKYTQYIHRSGMLLVEITEDGDFLALANRLYSNRAAAVQQAPPRPDPPTNDRVSRLIATGSYTGHSMAEPTPISSPMFRPVLFSSTQAAATREPPLLSHMSPRLGATKPAPPHNPGLATGEAESLVNKLESFCSDEETLEAFYKETLERANAPTPAVSASGDHESVSEAGIPVLGLPPGVLGGDHIVAGSPRGMTPTLASSLMLRRGSAQLQHL
ncbi:vacuolar membrane-associated protein iml-1 [Seiridium cupressi]